MPVQREARYLAPNDIGKTVTYEIPKSQYEPEGTKLLLGGVLQGMTATPRIVDDTTMFAPGPVLNYYLDEVVLTISGNEVRFQPNKVLTVYGTEEQ